jgi:Lipocalin-like domain
VEIMTRYNALLLIVGFLIGANGAFAQEKSQLVGTWTFVSSTSKNPDGSPAWGTNPKGIVIFTENGRYSSHVMRSDRPKFVANSRIQGTPDENKAAVHGGVASFGTYTVNQANQTFTIRYEGSSYPNLEGTEQIRSFTISGDELRVANPAPSVGGPPSDIVYRRAK